MGETDTSFHGPEKPSHSLSQQIFEHLLPCYNPRAATAAVETLSSCDIRAFSVEAQSQLSQAVSLTYAAKDILENPRSSGSPRGPVSTVSEDRTMLHCRLEFFSVCLPLGNWPESGILLAGWLHL